MTATLPPLGPTSEVWDHLPVVDAIAKGPDWPARVSAYWRATVDVRAHDLAHPQPIAGCEGCPQSMLCGWCGKVAPACPDPSDHYRRARGSEESLLTGAATGGA